MGLPTTETITARETLYRILATNTHILGRELEFMVEEVWDTVRTKKQPELMLSTRITIVFKGTIICYWKSASPNTILEVSKQELISMRIKENYRTACIRYLKGALLCREDCNMRIVSLEEANEQFAR